jgi:two-component system, OmpR family, phosphate regulon sensor histidine kinase PhoR
VTAAVSKPTESIAPRRGFGVRLWLGLAFVAVGIVTATSVYVLVSASSDERAEDLGTNIAVGEIFLVANRLEGASTDEAASIVASFADEDFRAWAFDAEGELVSSPRVSGVDLEAVPGFEGALDTALAGQRYLEQEGGTVRVASVPIAHRDEVDGAVVARATRPAEVSEAIGSVREDRLEALAIAVGVAILIGFLVATLLSQRLKRLAGSAAQLAEGRLDTPIESRGRDEIADLGRALEKMRARLRDSFELLSTERDRLSAILAALKESILVVSRDGEVQFSNPAADPLLAPGGGPVEELRPWLRRAQERGEARTDALRAGHRVFAIAAHALPAGDAVLVVVRDRTGEMRRELAEREFVSNAAHELRNPIAGVSGAIEVLRAGAKDDPEARERFLDHLAEDAERISRLTHSLLTLARVEALGGTARDVVDVGTAAQEAIQAVVAPETLTVSVDVERGLRVEGDAALVRQVLISLLSNAYRNTPPGGAVTLRARGDTAGEASIEVSDTGTGIPPEEQNRIFERFYRGSNSLEQEGFGLGLSIARRMVEVMGGEIGVRSEMGKGSTFWVRLPATKPVEAPVA